MTMMKMMRRKEVLLTWLAALSLPQRILNI